MDSACDVYCVNAQGSTLSTLLCNLYLADMEATHLADCLEPTAPRSGGSSGGHLSQLAKQAVSTGTVHVRIAWRMPWVHC